jgi:hypothetical protein
MSDTKYTQGPWSIKADPYENGMPYYRISAGDGYWDYDKKNGFNLSGIMSDGDARLIAAAPDLLRHAQSLLNGIDTELIVLATDADETLDYTMRGLRAAVAKATGDSNG